MSPARTNGKTGNFIINRRFKNVGAVKKSLETSNRPLFNRRVALLEKLFKQGRYELMRAWASDRVSIQALEEADEREELGMTLSTLKLRENLWDAIEAVLPQTAEGKATRARYARSLRALQRKGKKYLPDRATVADLAHVEWSELKAEWGHEGTDWMHMRRAVSRFLTKHLGDVYHPFRRRVIQDIPTARQNKRRPSLSLEQFREIQAKIQPAAQPAYLCIVVSGLRLGEFLAAKREHLNPSTHTLFVPPRKTETSDGLLRFDTRVWPLIANAIPARYARRFYQDTWADAVKAAGLPRVTIHDLRHVHGQWAVNAGVPESKVQSSLRHQSAGMTRQYVMQLDTLEVSTAIAEILAKKPPKRKKA